MLAGVDPTFSCNRWDQPFGHVETIINLSRPSKINPKVSAYTIVNGHFDYNKTPLATARMKTIVRVTANDRTTWGPHGESGWIVGSAPKNFRCWKVLIKRTNKIRTSNTVEVFPVRCGNPLLTEAEQISLLLRDLVKILSSPTRTLSSISYGDELNNALRSMQNLMCRHLDSTKRMPTTPLALQQPPVTPVAPETAAEPGVPTTPAPETEAAPTAPELGVPVAPKSPTEASQNETETIKPGVPPLVARQPRTRSQTHEQHSIGTIVRK